MAEMESEFDDIDADFDDQLDLLLQPDIPGEKKF